ncbi:unnamed protein product [Timema podura]|uniref:Malonyl-CoA:ACP transacylase (MAT) domain-containing protein n=1 Tax=Timema podura TaxID=61482 RepID=A0ABN7NJB9_TIMPD|nr:unnamed protein product [Timema podura]
MELITRDVKYDDGYVWLDLVTNPKPRSSKWVSSSVPESEWETPLAKYSSAEYHTNNLLSPVLFEESTKCIPNNAIVIEIAPHGLLQAIMRRSFGSESIHIPLTLRGHSKSHEFLLAAVGKLYMAGCFPKVSNLYPPVQYPVSRGTASLSSLVTWNHGDTLENLQDMDTSKLNAPDGGGARKSARRKTPRKGGCKEQLLIPSTSSVGVTFLSRGTIPEHLLVTISKHLSREYPEPSSSVNGQPTFSLVIQHSNHRQPAMPKLAPVKNGLIGTYGPRRPKYDDHAHSNLVLWAPRLPSSPSTTDDLMF